MPHPKALVKQADLKRMVKAFHDALNLTPVVEVRPDGTVVLSAPGEAAGSVNPCDRLLK